MGIYFIKGGLNVNYEKSDKFRTWKTEANMTGVQVPWFEIYAEDKPTNRRENSMLYMNERRSDSCRRMIFLPPSEESDTIPFCIRCE